MHYTIDDTVNVDIFACLHLCRFIKIDNFARIKIHQLYRLL